MKYHKHKIIKAPEDLGEEREQDNYVYKIFKDGKLIQIALTLSTAKDYIDSNYDETYL